MNILVTGGAGYLGSVLVPMLLSHGDQVTVADICMFGAEGLLPHVNNKLFHLEVGDIRDKSFVQKVFSQSFDAVIHLSALVGEPACKINPGLTKQINTEATIFLAAEAKKHGVARFIFTSTCSNYGVSSPEAFAVESSPLHPLSLYAETKIAAEDGIFSLGSTSFSVTILRLATLFGLSAKMRFNLLINEMVRDAWHGKDVVLYKEDSWRPFTHTADAARSIMTTLSADQTKVSGAIFNIGTDNLQKKSLVSLVQKHIPTLQVIHEGGLPDNRDYRVSFAKASKLLGFMPTMSIEQGIEEIVWALKHHIWSDPYDTKYSDWLKPEYFV